MRLLWSSLAILALGLGCSGPEVHFDYDVRANYQNFRTYDWYTPTKGEQARSGGVQNPIMDKRVRQAVEAQLSTRNFRRELNTDPDFLVIYYPIYQPRKGHRAHIGIGLGVPGMAVGVGAPVGSKPTGHIGSLALEVLDFKTHQTVWRAQAEEVLDDSVTPEESDELVARAVGRMLEKFPPPGSGAK